MTIESLGGTFGRKQTKFCNADTKRGQQRQQYRTALHAQTCRGAASHIDSD